MTSKWGVEKEKEYKRDRGSQRRSFIKGMGIVGVGTILSGCSGIKDPTPITQLKLVILRDGDINIQFIFDEYIDEETFENILTKIEVEGNISAVDSKFNWFEQHGVSEEELSDFLAEYEREGSGDINRVHMYSEFDFDDPDDDPETHSRHAKVERDVSRLSAEELVGGEISIPQITFSENSDHFNIISNDIQVQLPDGQIHQFPHPHRRQYGRMVKSSGSDYCVVRNSTEIYSVVGGGYASCNNDELIDDLVDEKSGLDFDTPFQTKNLRQLPNGSIELVPEYTAVLHPSFATLSSIWLTHATRFQIINEIMGGSREDTIDELKDSAHRFQEAGVRTSLSAGGSTEIGFSEYAVTVPPLALQLELARQGIQSVHIAGNLSRSISNIHAVNDSAQKFSETADELNNANQDLLQAYQEGAIKTHNFAMTASVMAYFSSIALNTLSTSPTEQNFNSAIKLLSELRDYCSEMQHNLQDAVIDPSVLSLARDVENYAEEIGDSIGHHEDLLGNIQSSIGYNTISDQEPCSKVTDEYPMHHADAANTGITRGAPITENDESPNILWERTVDSVETTPILIDGELIVPNESELVAVDACTGDDIWTKQLDSWITTPPVATENRIYVGLSSGDVVAIDRSDRTRIATANIGDRVQSLTLYNDTVYAFRNQRNLHAFSLNLQPKSDWPVRTGSFRGETPAVSSEGVVVSGGKGLNAYSHDGEELWSRGSADLTTSVAATTIKNGQVYHGTQATSGPQLVAIKLSNGETVARHERGPRLYSPPLIADNHLYVASSNGIERHQLDSQLTLDETLTTESRVLTTPVLSDDQIYALDEDMTIYAWDRETLSREWSLPLELRDQSRDPILADGKLFITNGLGAIVCITENGR